MRPISSFRIHTSVVVSSSHTPNQPMSLTNATQADPDYITWRSEPTFRGTFNIISTCLTTLTFCVWSSVHIDVPDNKRNALVQKLLWVLVGLLAPEILLITAYRQIETARQLRDHANACFGFPTQESWYQRSLSWSRSQFRARSDSRNTKVL